MTNLTQIYNILISKYGYQGWWPVTPTGCRGPEKKPLYGIGLKNDKQKFEIIVGAILTQNTAWKNVEKAIINLNKNNLIDIDKIIKIDEKELANLIRPSGYYNQKSKKLKAFARHLKQNYNTSLKKLFQKPTPSLRKELLIIHGIGPETADSIILYAAEKPVFVIDAYTKRIFSRIGLCKEDISYDELQKLFMDSLQHDTQLFNEYHALIVVHGKNVCKKKPLCRGCCLGKVCGFRKNLSRKSLM